MLITLQHNVSDGLGLAGSFAHLYEVLSRGAWPSGSRRWTLVLRVPDQLAQAGSLCPWARHFTLIVPLFGGHIKPSVPSEVVSTHFRM